MSNLDKILEITQLEKIQSSIIEFTSTNCR